MVYRVCLCLLCAVQVTMAQALSLGQVLNLFHEIQAKPALYCLGAFISFLVFFSLIHVSRRPLLMCGACAAILNLVSAINYYELLYHGTVLTWQDIKNLETAMGQMGNYSFQLTQAVGLMAFSYAAILLVLALMYYRGILLIPQRRIGLISAGGTILLCYALFLSPFAPVSNDGWSWEIIYYTDGFVVGSLENLHRTSIKAIKPDGYDVSDIQDAEGGPSGDDVYPDVILILNETYYDMDHLLDFDTDVSYMANYDALEAYKGYAAVPIVGGGTNASEYELLTGNAVTLLNTTTPFNDIDLNNSNNLVGYFHRLGYTTMAAHSEQASNYHRNDAWPALGFDKTYFQPDFIELSYYGRRYSASDASLFKNFIRFYEAMPESQPRFAYLLTIQNHGDWDRNDPEMDLVHIRNANGLTEFDQQRMNEYLTCVKQTDVFISDLIEYFSGQERRAVVYMVGDHAPSLVKDWKVGESDAVNLQKRQVPFFIWGNYDINASILPDDHNVDLCMLSPMALECAGLPLSAYYNQLIKVSNVAQCITNVTAMDSQGKSSRGYIHKNGTTESMYIETDEAKLVRDYFYMEYNGLMDKERLDALFDPVSGR